MLAILLTVSLGQKGSSESKSLTDSEDVYKEPQPHSKARWAVKKGEIYLKIYIAFSIYCIYYIVSNQFLIKRNLFLRSLKYIWSFKKKEVKFLEINWHEAEQDDCVSANISRIMALNVAKSFKSQWSIAVTGYGTPVKESGFMGVAWFSLCHNQVIFYTEKINFSSNIDTLKEQDCYSEIILSCLKTQL